MSKFNSGRPYHGSRAASKGGRKFEDVVKAAEQAAVLVLVIGSNWSDAGRSTNILYYRLVEDRAVISGLLYARFEPTKIEAMLKQRMG